MVRFCWKQLRIGRHEFEPAAATRQALYRMRRRATYPSHSGTFGQEARYARTFGTACRELRRSPKSQQNDSQPRVARPEAVFEKLPYRISKPGPAVLATAAPEAAASGIEAPELSFLEQETIAHLL